MKANSVAVFFFAFLAGTALSQSQIDPGPASDSSTQIVAETPYAIVSRDANQRIWFKVIWQSNSLTGTLTSNTASYTELTPASAHLVNGLWVDYNPQIEPTATGAQATNTLHPVSFLGNIKSPNAVDLSLPGQDKHLASSVIGLAYEDLSSSGKTARTGS